MLYRCVQSEVEAEPVDLAGIPLMVVMAGDRPAVLSREAFEALYGVADLSGEVVLEQSKREALREIHVELDAMQKGVGPAESGGTLDLTGYPACLQVPALNDERMVYNFLKERGPATRVQIAHAFGWNHQEGHRVIDATLELLAGNALVIFTRDGSWQLL